MLWEFLLEVERPQLVTRAGLHWLCSTWLDRPADSAESRTRSPSAPGHKDNSKPWSLRWIEPHNRGLLIQVGIMDDTPLSRSALSDSTRGLSEDLHDGILRSLKRALPDARMSLGNAGAFRTRAYVRNREEAPIHCVSTESWGELLNSPPIDSWRIDFRTTTSFRSGGRYIATPRPRLVTKSLRARWAADGPPLPIDPLRESRSFQLETNELNIRPSVERSSHGDIPGFIGSVEYRIEQRVKEHPVDDADRRCLGALLRLAKYAGIGVETRKGMGVAKVFALQPAKAF